MGHWPIDPLSHCQLCIKADRQIERKTECGRQREISRSMASTSCVSSQCGAVQVLISERFRSATAATATATAAAAGTMLYLSGLTSPDVYISRRCGREGWHVVTPVHLVLWVKQSVHSACLFVCLCVRAITFEVNDLWPRYLAGCFVFSLSRPSSKVKVIGYSSQSQEEICC